MDITSETPTCGNRWRRRICPWLVMAMIGAACLGWGAGLPADAVKAGEVAAKGMDYYGKKMTIYGYVSNPLTGQIFEVSDAVEGTASLPVIMKGPAVAVALGDLVVVEGTPVAFDAGSIRQDFGLNLPEEPVRGWKDRPVLIADKVRHVK